MKILADVPAILLVGGMGTRLRSVLPSTPKPLAPIRDKTFLELLIGQLRYQGIRRVVLCSGFLADQIETQFGDGQDFGVEIEYSREDQPLGTAGALKLALSRLGNAPDFLVMNGDSFLEIDFDRFIALHRQYGGLTSMATLRIENAARYGTVEAGTDGRIGRFIEKTSVDAPGLINGGVYAFQRGIFEHIPECPASLERDVFPRILAEGMYSFEQHGMFIDIGIPEDYARMRALWDQLWDTAFARPKMVNG